MVSSFDGNDGNDGNFGNSGNGGNSGMGTGGWFFADRISLPFVTVFDPVPIAAQRINITAYPDKAWTADWLSWVAVTEFAQTNWTAIALATVIPNGPPLQAEIDGLVMAAQDERADALGEILSQNEEFASYFMNAMSARPGSYPATALVLSIASLVGTFAAMYFKRAFARPRPSMLCPALLPPVSVPGHASFPSGHSTQSHLMALCMNEVFQNAPNPALPQQAAMQVDLSALADRISRNREVAGLHYPSDTAAGIELAGMLQNNLSTNPVNTVYVAAIAKAQTEWA